MYYVSLLAYQQTGEGAGCQETCPAWKMFQNRWFLRSFLVDFEDKSLVQVGFLYILELHIVLLTSHQTWLHL